MRTAFCKTVIGASHISSNKPCQDYSIAETNSDYSIIIVSDGHGSDTYVRSDVGSKIAATIAKQKTIEFLPTLYSLTELKKKALFVGAKPESTVAKAYVHKVVNKASEQLQQDIKYYESVEGIENVDEVIRNLFSLIHRKWLDQIEEDSRLHPFSEAEQKKLGQNSIVKAYGCTLICCIATKDFYFAYQIGDGKCYISSVENEWTQPIPWDCNCFLNITTSLCIEDKPISNLFRYAFDSKDYLPTVIFIGSDGVDGSYDTEKVLELDYASIVDACVNTPDIHAFENVDLADFLTQKSQAGSKDDMSLCGIIENEYIKEWLELNQLKREAYIEETKGSKIKKEIGRLEQIISKQQERIKDLQNKKNQNDNEVNSNNSFIRKLEEKIEGIKKDIQKRIAINQSKESENQVIDNDLSPLLLKEKENRDKLVSEYDRYEKWKNEAKESVQGLREERDVIIKRIHKSIGVNEEQINSSTSFNSKGIDSNYDEIISSSDQIIFAKIGGYDEDTYTYNVSGKLLSYEISGTVIQKSFNDILFDEIKKKIKEIAWPNYSQKASYGNKYCYITFLQNEEEIKTFFIPLYNEELIKPFFSENIKLNQL